MARYPTLGRVKTRLAREIGKAGALRVYRRLLDHHLGEFRRADFEVEWRFTPARAPFAKLARNARPQPEGNLGERMQQIFAESFLSPHLGRPRAGARRPVHGHRLGHHEQPRHPRSLPTPPGCGQTRQGGHRRLNAQAAARVSAVLTRLADGNFSNVKGVGSGVFECRIDFGPGYRIYLGKDGERLVILLGGGSKKRQQHDINVATENWQDYKRRK